MKTYHSLDFDSPNKRLEKNTSGDYLVHLEDYENINDLIDRAVRCKRKFVPEVDERAEFDDIFEEGILEKLQEEKDRLEQEKIKAEQSATDAKQSDGQVADTSADDVSVPML